jgi:hypothetical protein
LSEKHVEHTFGCDDILSNNIAFLAEEVLDGWRIHAFLVPLSGMRFFFLGRHLAGVIHAKTITHLDVPVSFESAETSLWTRSGTPSPEMTRIHRTERDVCATPSKLAAASGIAIRLRS